MSLYESITTLIIKPAKTDFKNSINFFLTKGNW